MIRSVLIGLLAIALFAPAASVSAQDSDDYAWAYVFAGQSQNLRIDVGPNAIEFLLDDITVEGQLASDARTAIDNLRGVGDGDGTLTAEEVVDFEALATATINANLPDEFDFDMVTMDGKQASSSTDDAVITITKLDLSGAEGPVTSEDPIKTDISTLLRFDSVDQSSSTHQVRFENLYGDFTSFDSSDAPPQNIIVTGYSSWSIQKDTIEPVELRDRLSNDELALTNEDFQYFDEVGEGLLFTIEGDPSVQLNKDTESSPGIGIVSLVGVLGLALVALRRRS